MCGLAIVREGPVRTEVDACLRGLVWVLVVVFAGVLSLLLVMAETRSFLVESGPAADGVLCVEIDVALTKICLAKVVCLPKMKIT